MKLVSPVVPYESGKADLTPDESKLAMSVFEVIQAFRREVSEHDEDPEFDFDDAISAVMKSYGFGRNLAAHFMADPNVLKDVEAIAHGVVRNLGVMDEPTPAPDETPEPEPGVDAWTDPEDASPDPDPGRGITD